MEAGGNQSRAFAASNARSPGGGMKQFIPPKPRARPPSVARPGTDSRDSIEQMKRPTQHRVGLFICWWRRGLASFPALYRGKASLRAPRKTRPYPQPYPHARQQVRFSRALRPVRPDPTDRTATGTASKRHARAANTYAAFQLGNFFETFPFSSCADVRWRPIADID